LLLVIWMSFSTVFITTTNGIPRNVNGTCTLRDGCSGSNTTLLPYRAWTGIECNQVIPKNAVASFTVLGNGSALQVHLLSVSSFNAFLEGAGVAGALLTKQGWLNNSLEYDYTFDSRENSGVYFVVYNPKTKMEVNVSYDLRWTTITPNHPNDNICYSQTTQADCEQARNSKAVLEDCCIWCTNPCYCMPAKYARGNCYEGWHNACSGEIHALEGPTGMTAILSWATVVVFVLLIICVLALFGRDVVICVKLREI